MRRLLIAQSLRSMLDALHPLWISGLVLLLVTAVSLLREQLDAAGLLKPLYLTEVAQLRMLVYLTLGTVFPAGVLVLALFRMFLPALARYLVELPLAVFGVLRLFQVLLEQVNQYALALAVSQWTVTLGLKRLVPKAEISEAAGTSWADSLVNLFLTVVGWTLLLQLFREGKNLFEPGFASWAEPAAFAAWAREGWSFLPVLVLAFLLVLMNLHGTGKVRGWGTRSLAAVLEYAATALALGVFAVLSFRSDVWTGDYYLDAFLHWTYYVAAADDVRRGGWLLWDVPSWYGFLNVLLVAALPVEGWHALFLLNAAALFASAVFLFVLLRSLRPGWVSWLFALVVTVACVFLLPGRLYAVTGPQIWPRTVAFRFLWVYVLLAILLWGARRAERGQSSRPVHWAGCLAWLVGVLWSFESAFFSSAVWLPAYALLVWHHGSQGSGTTSRERLPAILGWLLLPELLFAAVAGGIVLYYRARLGHAPDVHAYYEVAHAFNEKFSEWFYVGPLGLWIILFVFCTLATAAVSVLRDGATWSAAVIVAAWAALWAACSYVASKADAYTLLSAAPLLVATLGVTLSVLDRSCPHSPLTAHLTAVFGCVLITQLTLAFGNLPKLVEAASKLTVGYDEIAAALPILEPAQSGLLASAGVRPDDPLLVLHTPTSPLSRYPGPSGGNADSRPTRSWLPLPSWERLHVFENDVLLSEDRQRQLVSRAIARSRASGYILVSKSTKAGAVWSWFFAHLTRTHAAKLVAESAEYELLRYDYRGDVP